MKSFLNLFRKKLSSDISATPEKDVPASSPSFSFISSSPTSTPKKHKTHVVKKPRPYKLNRYAKAVAASNGNPAALAKALQMQGDPPKDLPVYETMFKKKNVLVKLAPSTEYKSDFVVVEREEWVAQKYIVTYGKIPNRVKIQHRIHITIIEFIIQNNNVLQ